MESRVEQAVESFRSGCNCAQAVFVTYADLFGIDKATAMRLASSFGAGLAGMRHVCGTVSGMSMLAGLHNGASSVEDKEGRKRNFETVRLLAQEFSALNGSIRCGQLLGLEPGLPDGFSKKPCAEYVRTCAVLVEKYLLPRP